MSEWIELKYISPNDTSVINKMSLQAFNIKTVEQTGGSSCRVRLEDQNNTYINTAESYEEVMQKIRRSELREFPMLSVTKEKAKYLYDIILQKVGITSENKDIVEELEAIMESGDEKVIITKQEKA